MSWVLLSLLAPLFWATSNFVDKYILGKESKGIYDYLFFTTLSSWLFFIILFIFIGLPGINLYSLIPFATGIMLVYSYGFYGKALEKGDTSSLVILFELIPVLTVFLALIFLGQNLLSNEWLGFIVVLVGTTIVSFESGKKNFIKGFWLIMIAIVIWSIMTLLSDYGLTKISFWDYFLIDNFGSAIAGPLLLFIPSMRRQILSGLRTAKLNKYVLYSWNNLLDFFGQMSIKKALAIAPSAGLVTVVMQAQSFYAIIIGIILTLIIPSVLKENIEKRTLLKKFVGAGIMFLGVYLILK